MIDSFQGKSFIRPKITIVNAASPIIPVMIRADSPVNVIT